MKASNLPNHVWSFMKDGTDKQQLIAIYVFAALATGIVLLGFERISIIDTETYFLAGDRIVNGGIDPLRTPVYPLICFFAKSVCPKHPFVILEFINISAFWISILYMYRLSKLFVTSRIIVFVITLFYACTPDIILWAAVMMTDSLAIPLLVILCYSVVKGYKTMKIKYSILSFLLLLVQLFLRPIFIFMFPILLLLWIFCLINNKKSVTSYANLAFLLIVGVACFAYCKTFEKKYGIFGMSIVSTVNQYDILRNNNLTDPNVIKNEKMRADIKDSIPIVHNNLCVTWHHNERRFILRKYGYAAWKQYVNDNIKEHFGEYCVCTAKRFVKLGSSPSTQVNFWFYRPKNIIIRYVTLAVRCVIELPYNAVYALIFVSGIVFLINGIRRHKVPVLSFFLWLIVVANVFTAIVGAQADYARLSIPCLPMSLLIIAILVDAFSIKIKIRKNFSFQ